MDIMVMQNTAMLEGKRKLQFDLKGSSYSRKTKFDLKEVLKTKSSKKCLKDLDFKQINEKMRLIKLDREVALAIQSTLKKDSAFLCSEGLMDYSLLMVIEQLNEPGLPSRNTLISGSQAYHIGVIDFL
jgi:hypothetical protein